jgi:hypothetical protein
MLVVVSLGSRKTRTNSLSELVSDVFVDTSRFMSMLKHIFFPLPACCKEKSLFSLVEGDEVDRKML